MKAIQQFISEAVSEFGAGSTITETQVKSVLKKIKRAIGIGHIRQTTKVELLKDGKYKLPSDVAITKVSKPKKVSTPIPTVAQVETPDQTAEI